MQLTRDLFGIAKFLVFNFIYTFYTYRRYCNARYYYVVGWLIMRWSRTLMSWRNGWRIKFAARYMLWPRSLPNCIRRIHEITSHGDTPPPPGEYPITENLKLALTRTPDHNRPTRWYPNPNRLRRLEIFWKLPHDSIRLGERVISGSISRGSPCTVLDGS